VLGIEGGPLVSLVAATNILAALTGSASGGLTIALDALGPTYMQTGFDPGLMHRVAVIGAGTLDSLPHNGAVVTLLAVCGSARRKLSRYRHGRDCRPDPSRLSPLSGWGPGSVHFDRCRTVCMARR
jgi:Mg2+/citrate symporter